MRVLLTSCQLSHFGFKWSEYFLDLWGLVVALTQRFFWSVQLRLGEISLWNIVDILYSFLKLASVIHGIPMYRGTFIALVKLKLAIVLAHRRGPTLVQKALGFLHNIFINAFLLGVCLRLFVGSNWLLLCWLLLYWVLVTLNDFRLFIWEIGWAAPLHLWSEPLRGFDYFRLYFIVLVIGQSWWHLLFEHHLFRLRYRFL